MVDGLSSDEDSTREAADLRRVMRKGAKNFFSVDRPHGNLKKG